MEFLRAVIPVTDGYLHFTFLYATWLCWLENVAGFAKNLGYFITLPPKFWS